LFLVLRDAAAQRLDEIDGPAGHGKTLLGLRQPGLLGPQVRQQGLLIAVAETRRREARGLAVENVRGEPEQLGRRRQVRYLAEIVLGVAHLINAPLILPMSVRSSRSITVGTRFTGAVYGGDTASSAPPGNSCTSRRRPAW